MILELHFTGRYEEKLDDISAVRPEFREKLLTELEASGQQAIQEMHEQATAQMADSPQASDDE